MRAACGEMRRGTCGVPLMALLSSLKQEDGRGDAGGLRREGIKSSSQSLREYMAEGTTADQHSIPP